VRAKSAAEHEQPIGTFNFQAGDFVALARDGNGLLLRSKRVVETGEILTPTESKRLRQSLKQAAKGETRPWAEIKDELGL
jgi:hypothetical protein